MARRIVSAPARFTLLALISVSVPTLGQVRFPGAGGGGSNNRPARPSFPPGSQNPGVFPGFPGNNRPQQQQSVACTDFTGIPGQCVPAIACTQLFAGAGNAQGTPSVAACVLSDGLNGVCCPPSATPSFPAAGGGGQVFAKPFQDVQIRQTISQNNVRTAGQSGQGTVNQILEIESRLKAQESVIAKGSPASFHQQFFKVSPDALTLARGALVGIEASRNLVREYGLSALEAGYGLQKFNLGGANLANVCPPLPNCQRANQQRYRTIDGSCNNLRNPSWGMTNTAMQRILPPTYNDGVWEPRQFSRVTGQPLPSARAISTAAIHDTDSPDDFLTLLVMQWGQFLDHDMTHAGVFKLDAQQNTGILCCRNNNPINPAPHPACMPIDIPQNDRFYSRFGNRCMEFVRVFEARSGSPEQVLELRNVFNNPSFLNAPGAADGLVRGMTLQPMQTFDNSITEELTNQLFKKNNPFGMDLISLNIHRGRDHGLPTYNDMRELCGIGRANNFNDLSFDMGMHRLQSVYASVEDIDLFIGGVSENPLPDAVLGPTFICILGDQFTRAKRGDRFFYDLGGQPHSFNEVQLNEIRQVSFARILCDNTDVGEMQPLAFIRPSFQSNNKHDCSSPSIPRINLQVWRF
ncbi:unnamed protein product [Notodromas monacha]|uniref:Peroxinectin n=1 Tax=Notodromas monacha TaxID=399045 RepID=A0A7R9GC27_9CRUS|nr:unnamed protein product [Notodromas monacha]CAG0917148.1 unnamed protein product [Notodromas monacha]